MSRRRAFGSIRKRNSRYYGQYRVDGHAYYTPTRDTKGEVRADLIKIEAAIITGEWSPSTSKRSTRKQPYEETPTVADWGLMWLERLEREGRSEGTIRAYKSAWRAHICPVLGKDTPIRDIGKKDARLLYDYLTMRCSPSVRYNVLRAFSSAMHRAEEEGLIDEAPQLPGGAMAMPRRRRSPVTLTHKQIQALVDNVPPSYRAAIALAAWGALRSGEVAALRRNDFPPDCSTVRVDESTKRDSSGRTVIGVPKTRSSERTVALPEVAQTIVAQHLEYFTGAGDDALLFPAPRTGGPVADKTLLTVLRNGAGRVGLPSSIVFHDLRHTGLTLYGRAGATTADLMARAGHSSPETVQIYQHSGAERDRELTERM